MNSQLTAVLFLTLLIGAVTCKLRKDQDTDRLIQEMTNEIELKDAVDEMEKLSRARRVPSNGARKACGRKLILFVLNVCGEPCDPTTAKDISVVCCGQPCTDEQVKEACCPNKLF